MGGYSELMSTLISLGIFLVLCAIPATAWIRWFKRTPERNVYTMFSLAGLVLATFSALLAVGDFITSYFHPMFRELTALGVLSALPALVCSLCGIWRKNPIRWHALAASVLILVLWFGSSMSI